MLQNNPTTVQFTHQSAHFLLTVSMLQRLITTEPDLKVESNNVIGAVLLSWPGGF